MCFRNQCAHWWRKHFIQSAGRPENPQIFRPAQSFPSALKRHEVDFERSSMKRRRSGFSSIFYATSPHPVSGQTMKSSRPMIRLRVLRIRPKERLSSVFSRLSPITK